MSLSKLFGGSDQKPIKPEVPKIDELSVLISEMDSRRQLWIDKTKDFLMKKLESFRPQLTLASEVRKVSDIVNRDIVILEFKRTESKMSYNVLSSNNEGKKGNIYFMPGQLAFSMTNRANVLISMRLPYFTDDQIPGHEMIGVFEPGKVTDEIVEEAVQMFLKRLSDWYNNTSDGFISLENDDRARDAQGRFI